MAPLPRVIAVVGATATGKTALGAALAERLGGEVVCADSRQVFRQLEIGTGKPTPVERARSPHHLFDSLTLGEPASAGWYARAAAEACAAIVGRGRTPVLVGGSGLYLHALQSGLAALPPTPPGIRDRLRSELETAGAEALHRRLRDVDPITAARLDPRDAQRVTRALEVAESSGHPLSWWHAQGSRPALEAEWRIVELTLEPAALGERIDARTRAMFATGLIEETAALVECGLGAALGRLRAVGYDETLELIAGRIDRRAAEERTSLRTRQLAKRQRTWFRNQIAAVRFDAATRLESQLEAAIEVAGRSRH